MGGREGVYSRDTGRGNSREGGGRPSERASSRVWIHTPHVAHRTLQNTPHVTHRALQNTPHVRNRTLHNELCAPRFTQRARQVALEGAVYGRLEDLKCPPPVLIGHASSLLPY